MVGVALEIDPLERTVGRGIELVGAGAGGVRGEPGRRPVVVALVRLHGARVHDHHDRHGRQERRVGLVEHEAHRVLVRRRDVVGLQHRLEGAGRRLADRQHAPEAVDHVVRRDLAAVVEFGVRPELELPGLAVLRDGVRLREPGLQFGRIALVAVEVVVRVEAVEHHRHVEDLVRVEIGRQVVAGDQHPGLCRARLRNHDHDSGHRGRSGYRFPDRHRIPPSPFGLFDRPARRLTLRPSAAASGPGRRPCSGQAPCRPPSRPS